MKLPVYIVDAFTDKLFSGNPAAVCPLEHWLSDKLMQDIATENNLSDTAFFVKNDDHYDIRWFTPATEIKLCGHATLASAHVLFTELGYTKNVIEFNSLSGLLKVQRTADGKIQLDFPANMPEQTNDIPDGLFEGLGIKNAPVYKSFDYMVVLPTQADVEILNPDFKTLAKVKARGVIATAKGNEADFISRCFFPQSGINEDSVTGSAHTITVPYWAEQLVKTKLKAIQLSKRRGYLDCELVEDRVLMSGEAVTYLKGEYNVGN
jgi:PhzF family phenazine biosynthesis protein